MKVAPVKEQNKECSNDLAARASLRFSRSCSCLSGLIGFSFVCLFSIGVILTPNLAFASDKLSQAKILIQTGNFSGAETILRKLDDGKNAEVLLILGNLFNGTSNYKIDYKKSFSLYRQSAGLGNAEAAYNIGVLFFNGRGVPQNYQKAFEWYSLASQSGYPPAQNNLGFLHQKGMGVPQSNSNAYGWYSIAAANGSKAGLRNRDILLAQLLEDEGAEVVSEIQTKALQCVQNNYTNCFGE